MKCPTCSQKYNCPCVNCVKNFPNKLPKFIAIEGPVYQESCPNCGEIRTLDDWFEEEGIQYEAEMESKK